MKATYLMTLACFLVFGGALTDEAEATTIASVSKDSGHAAPPSTASGSVWHVKRGQFVPVDMALKGDFFSYWTPRNLHVQAKHDLWMRLGSDKQLLCSVDGVAYLPFHDIVDGAISVSWEGDQEAGKVEVQLEVVKAASTVTEQDIDIEIDRVLRDQNINRQQLNATLSALRMSEASYRAHLKKELAPSLDASKN